MNWFLKFYYYRSITMISVCLVICLLSVTICYAQQDLLPGSIITKANDTLHGFIKYRNWEKNPKEVDFYRNQNDKATSYSPLELKSFTVSGETYSSAVVTIDDSPFRTDNLKEEVVYNYKTDTVFLLTLINGEKSLFYYMDVNGKEHFFIPRDSLYELLMFKRYLKRADNGIITIAQNNKYIGQLSIYLQDCSTIQDKLAGLQYSKNDLVKLFNYYYICTNRKIVSQNKSFKKNEFGFIAGVSFSKLIFVNGMDYFKEANFPVSANFSAGLFYNLVFPRNFGRFSINNRLLYYAYKTEAYYNENNRPVTTSVGMNYILLNIMASYKYPVKKLGLFFEGGATLGMGFNETNYQKFEETSSQYASEGKAFSEMEKVYMGVNLGIGLKINKYTIESFGMFGFKKTDFVQVSHTGIASKLNTVFLMLGYHF